MGWGIKSTSSQIAISVSVSRVYLYLLSQTAGPQRVLRSFPGISSKGGKESVFHPSLGPALLQQVLEDLNQHTQPEGESINILANTEIFIKDQYIFFRTNSFSKRTC